MRLGQLSNIFQKLPWLDVDGFGVCFEMGKKCYRMMSALYIPPLSLPPWTLYPCVQQKDDCICRVHPLIEAEAAVLEIFFGLGKKKSFYNFFKMALQLRSSLSLSLSLSTPTLLKYVW